MPKSATRVSDVQEVEWSEAIALGVRGILVAIVAGIVLYFFKRLLPPIATSTTVLEMLAVIGILSGLAIMLVAVRRAFQARHAGTVLVQCPYCDADNKFLEAPTTDFTCEHCDRQVHYENGAMIPVLEVECQSCHAKHRVAENVHRYVCDSCNRALKLGKAGTDANASFGANTGDALLQNYDVLLVAFDRRKENEMAFKLQNLLVVNMNEARRLMHTAGPTTPLLVAQNVPERKANSIRQQLQELGATSRVQPTASAGARPAQPAR